MSKTKAETKAARAPARVSAAKMKLDAMRRQLGIEPFEPPITVSQPSADAATIS